MSRCWSKKSTRFIEAFTKEEYYGFRSSYPTRVTGHREVANDGRHFAEIHGSEDQYSLHAIQLSRYRRRNRRFVCRAGERLCRRTKRTVLRSGPRHRRPNSGSGCDLVWRDRNHFPAQLGACPAAGRCGLRSQPYAERVLSQNSTPSMHLSPISSHNGGGQVFYPTMLRKKHVNTNS